MANKIKLCSININGLNFDKIQYLNQKLIEKKVDVAFLQETHIDDKERLSVFENEMREFKIFTELGENKTKGVAILVSRKSEIKTINFEFYENRIICCDCLVNGVEINLVNIYAPNTMQEQLDFIERLSVIIHNKKKIIIGGDFNFVESELKDRMNIRTSKKSVPKKNVTEWLNFFSSRLLEEASVCLGSDHLRTMTWSNGIQSSRIDRFYIKKGINSHFVYSGNECFIMSDHRIIFVDLFIHTANVKIKNFNNKNDWKLNEEVLSDTKVNKLIENECEDIRYFKKKHKNEWYEIFISSIIKMLKRESRVLSEKKKKDLQVSLKKSKF